MANSKSAEAVQETYNLPSAKVEQICIEDAQEALNRVDVDRLQHESLSFKSKATLRLAVTTIIWGLTVSAFAIDLSVMGSLASVPAFREYYGTSTSGAEWGIIIAIYSIGNIVASCFQWLGDVIGRRGIACCGCILLTIGCLIQAAAPNTDALIAGRFVAGAGSALAATIGPAYMAEIAPSCFRGLAVGIYCSCYYLGAIIIAGVLLGSSYMDSVWSFRLPLTFQIGPPAIVTVLIWLFTPESPRWLIAKGRVDTAKSIIARYHTTSEDINDPIVATEVAQILASLELIEAAPWDFSAFWKTPSGRYRLLVIIIYSFFQQFNGGGLLAYYLPGILELVGITGAQDQLAINLGMVAANWTATLVGASFVDRITRRFILINTMVMFCIFLALMAIVNGLYANGIAMKAMGVLTIVFIYAFNICIGLFLNVLHNVYPSEVLHYSQRAKGMGLYSLFQSAFGFAMTYGGAAALTVMKWKIYFLFFGIDLLCMYLAWKYFPEFRRLSLEEIDLVFETPTTGSSLTLERAGPVRVSLKLQESKVAKQKEDARRRAAAA
ncbi:general substrate transporter [Dactylonectria macrodidyma]|uniref:General substrate transporter n=1 Tax=Dactylonectria macrodidyma TaxID=307937 RepID=A0A9P9DXE1_9HYPO|nr:general substrate transporter [Dactylonectria macrodidyma]